jgi:Flp pilus assembly secretin CpaC
VPVISEVPLFGKVFVSKDVKKTNKNLLIMITPVLREL